MPIGYEPTLDEIAPRLSWREYLRLDPPPRLRFEYEAGRLLVSSAAHPRRDLLRGLLELWLGNWRRRRPRGSVVVIAESSFHMPKRERDYHPDIGIVIDDRARGPHRRRPVGWDGAPSIAIEVLSPSTRARDLGLEARRYFEQGTLEYWTFDPLVDTVTFRRRGDSGWVEVGPDGGRYETPLLPGFVLDLGAFWAEYREIVD